MHGRNRRPTDSTRRTRPSSIVSPGARTAGTRHLPLSHSKMDTGMSLSGWYRRSRSKSECSLRGIPGAQPLWSSSLLRPPLRGAARLHTTQVRSRRPAISNPASCAPPSSPQETTTQARLPRRLTLSLDITPHRSETRDKGNRDDLDNTTFRCSEINHNTPANAREKRRAYTGPVQTHQNAPQNTQSAPRQSTALDLPYFGRRHRNPADAKGRPYIRHQSCPGPRCKGNSRRP